METFFFVFVIKRKAFFLGKTERFNWGFTIFLFFFWSREVVTFLYIIIIHHIIIGYLFLFYVS
jgi:hypothetical protein